MGRLKKKLSVRSRQLVYHLFYGIAAVLTGLVSVGYAKSFHYAEHVFWKLQSAHPHIAFVLTPLCFVVGWWLVKTFAPMAAGSGLPQVAYAAELPEPEKVPIVHQIFSFKAMVIKIVSSICCAFGGGAMGREGPTAQLAGGIFFQMGRLFKLKIGKTKIDNWVVAGAASGIAAAFNTPLGGIVFAIEELSRNHLKQFRSILMISVILGGLTSQVLLGPYLLLGYPVVNPGGWTNVIWAVGIGALLGVLGAVVTHGLWLVLELKRKIKWGRYEILVPLCCGLVIAATASVLGNETFGSGFELLRRLLFDASYTVTWQDIVARVISPFVSYLSGASGGVFAPILAIGGTIAGLIGQWFNPENVHLMVLMGMIGTLTGLTRAPLTSFVLVFEMTDRHTLIFPLLVAAISATLVTQWVIKKSFYDLIKEGLEERYT
ncbi:MAG: chloride channel protein [Candidatus Margulisiibacteriota bacterium]